MTNLAGQTMVITGASDGIGAIAAKELSRRGAKVVVVGRSPEKTRAVAQAAGSEPYICDFADLAQVKALAEKLKADHSRIDVLLNNAGLLWDKRLMTKDGHELTFQVNHLAPFLLTNLLKERLIESKARIINTSSIGNMMGNVQLDDLESEKRYSAMQAYATSKLENILFTKELVRRWGDQGITSAAFHPGPVASQFGNGASSYVRLVYHTPLRHLLLITPEKGADTMIWLASSQPGKDWNSGSYYAKRKLGRVHRQTLDAKLAEGLWDKSLAMVKDLL
jgi:NAD(P)-dependent dehydrogenase (short-subunit alcohol dehydrogenase family)